MKSQIDQRDIFIKGKLVILKALTRDDVVNSDWYGWFNDEDLCKTLQKHYFANTLEAQLKFWEDNIKGATNKLQLGICRIDESPIIGVISLNNIDFISRKAEMSIIVGKKESQDISIFIESCKLLFNHAFYSLNLNRIYGGSISRELVQLMCRTLRCKEEGIARQDVFKHGKYHDAYRYSVLRDEFSSFEDQTSA